MRLCPFLGDERGFDDLGAHWLVPHHDGQRRARLAEVLAHVAHGDAGVQARGERSARD